MSVTARSNPNQIDPTGNPPRGRTRTKSTRLATHRAAEPPTKPHRLATNGPVEPRTRPTGSPRRGRTPNQSEPYNLPASPSSRTVQLPVVVQAPHDRRTVALFRNYMKRSLVLQQESLNALLDKREDRTEKRKLEEDRLKFEEEKRRAYLSLEEERKKFEEYKKQFAPKVLIEEEKGTTQSKIVNKLEAAEKHVSLFEKVVGIPKKSVELVKNIKENKDIVKNFMDRAKLIAKYLAPGSVGFLIEQMKEMAGLGGSGDAGEGLNDAVVVSNGGVTPIEGNAGGNGAGNGPNSGGNGAGNGPNSGALKVVNGAGKAPNGGALKVASSNGALKVPAVSTDDVGTAVAGASTVSTCTGTVSTTEVASAGAGGATVATTGDAVTGGAAATVSESTRDVCAKVVPTIGAKAE